MTTVTPRRARGLVVTGLGVGAVLTVDGPVGGAPFAPVVRTTVGAGAGLAMLLPRVGIPVDGLSVAGAVLLSGLFSWLASAGRPRSSVRRWSTGCCLPAGVSGTCVPRAPWTARRQAAHPSRRSHASWGAGRRR